MEYCSVHHLVPVAGQCKDCGQSFCKECLDPWGRCVYCAQSTERFLDGFGLALGRWESDLRDSMQVQSAQPALPLRRRFTLRRVILGALLAVVLFYGASFLLNYHLVLGQLMLQRGNVDQALVHLEKAAQKEPNNPEISLYLGNLYYQKGYYDQAILAYSETIALDSTNAGAYNNLAWIYAETGRKLDEALQLSRRSLELDPDNPEFLDTQAEIYYKRKEYLRALAFIRKAVEQNPPNIDYYREKLEKIRRMAYGDNKYLEI